MSKYSLRYVIRIFKGYKMTSNNKWHNGARRYWWVIILAAVFSLLLVVSTLPVTYRITQKIDVNSGMKKEQVEIFRMTIDSEISDTRFSRFAKANLDVKGDSSWETESMRFLWLTRRPSPHFRYHGAFQSLDSLMDAFEVAGTDELRKQELAQQALLHLQKGEMFTVYLNRGGDVELRTAD